MWLGLDIGASGSRWALLSEDREPLGGQFDRGVQVASMDADRGAEALAALLGVVRSALGNAGGEVLDGTVVAVAGAGDPNQALAIEERLGGFGGGPLRVVGDVLAAAAAALAEGPGIALWSGTGSFAVARDRTGGLHRRGGRGFVFGDQGSAHALVRAAGTAALAGADGTGPATRLGAALATALEVGGVLEIGAAAAARSPAALAALAPVVVQTAEQGDTVARAVLEQGARDLVDLAAVAARAAGLVPGETPLIMGGGALVAGGPYFAATLSALEATQFAEHPRLAQRTAAQGAAILARAVACGEQPLASWLAHGC